MKLIFIHGMIFYSFHSGIINIKYIIITQEYHLKTMQFMASKFNIFQKNNFTLLR